MNTLQSFILEFHIFHLEGFRTLTENANQLNSEEKIVVQLIHLVGRIEQVEVSEVFILSRGLVHVVLTL